MWPIKGRKWASEGVDINDNLNSNERKLLYFRLTSHEKSNNHWVACAQYSKSENKTDEVKVEMNDSDDEQDERTQPLDEILPEIGENQVIKMEPTDEIENKIDESESNIPRNTLEYLDHRVMKKHNWLEICDGKLFCQVKK